MRTTLFQILCCLVIVLLPDVRAQALNCCECYHTPFPTGNVDCTEGDFSQAECLSWAVPTYGQCVFHVSAHCGEDNRCVHEPSPFTISVTGTVNGEAISYGGDGVVDPVGVYSSTLTFDNLPPGLHPVAVSAYTMSICCYRLAAVRNGAVNLAMLLGGQGYSSVRTLFFPGGQTLVIEGVVSLEADGTIRFDGTVSGEVDLPDDLTGTAVYQATLTPNGGGSIVSEGSGTLYTSAGPPVRLELSTSTSFDETKTLPDVQFRTIMEEGSLAGSEYTVTLHSVLDTRVPGGPAASEWALIVMALVVLAAGTITLRRRHAAPA